MSQKYKGVAWARGHHVYLPQKDIEKKANLTELSQDEIFNILMLWAKCMPIDFEFQQGVFFVLTNCQT